MKKVNDERRNWKKYSLFLLYSNLFVIIASFASLNRLAGNPLDCPCRIYVEHVIAGIGMPLIFTLLTFSFLIMIRDFTRKIEISFLFFWTLFWLVFEILWQFLFFYNSDSWLQMLFFIIGIIILWFLYYSVLLKEGKK